MERVVVGYSNRRRRSGRLTPAAKVVLRILRISLFETTLSSQVNRVEEQLVMWEGDHTLDLDYPGWLASSEG